MLVDHEGEAACFMEGHLARIRTIKPEFWTDAKIASLPKPTALFFIALWTFADDQGIVTDDPRTLSLQVPIYRSQDVEKMLKALWQAGLVLRSPGDGLVLVRGWHHQRIDRPRDGKFKGKEIKWLTWSDDTKPREQSTQGEERRGEEGSGEELRKGRRPKTPAVVVNLGQLAVAAYCDAWKGRYGSNPSILPRDAKTLKGFAESFGLARCKTLIEAYLAMHDSWFLTKRHDVQTLANNLAAVSHFADTGETVTKADIRRADASVTNLKTLKAIEEEGI